MAVRNQRRTAAAIQVHALQPTKQDESAAAA